MKAAVFVRYHSGDGFGHLAWAFEISPGAANAGSVENHSGHIFTPATQMGFWSGSYDDPVTPMREHRYDDLKWLAVERADPLLAYRTVLWIKHEAYKALHRNCEDDVYDVLRAYGIEHLALPSLIWFPKSWFKRFRGTLAHVTDYRWQSESAQSPGEMPPYQHVQPWRPTWRRPWHADFHALKTSRLQLLLRRG